MACIGVAGFGLRPSGMRKNQSSPGLHKTTQKIIAKFGVKAAHWPRKKPCNSGGNPDHVVIVLALDYGLWLSK